MGGVRGIEPKARRSSSAAICVLLLLFAARAGAAIELKDDDGSDVRLAQPARRIVALAPFLTELVHAAGAGARLVGVSAHSDHPPEVRRLPQVSSAARIDIERIAALAPDLVVAWRDSAPRDDVERLRRLGIAVFVAQARRLDDVPRLLEAIGALTARPAAADEAKRFRERVRALRERHGRGAPLAVFVEIWHRPLTTVSGPHWINEALAVCGARNAFDDLPGVAPIVSWEALYARDPEAIVGAGSAATAAQFRANWAARASLPAVKAGRLVFVEPDLLQRPGPRLAEGVARLCAGLEGLATRQ